MKTTFTSKIDHNIAFQAREISRELKIKKTKKLPTITISREFGCEGYPLAQALETRLSSEQYKWSVYSRDLLNAISEEAGLTDEIEKALSEGQRNQITQDLEHLLRVQATDLTKYLKIAKNFKAIGEKGGSIVVGSGGAILGGMNKNYFHVRLTGSRDFRVKRISEAAGISIEEAREHVDERSLMRTEFISRYTGKNVADPEHYHMILRNDLFNADDLASIIIHAMQLKKML